MPPVDVQLLRRVRNEPERLKPGEVLAYFAQLAGARIVVTKNAWRVEAYANGFDATERLFALLDTLLFPTLMHSSRARLRAKREFVYAGEKLLFVRHLRISNQTGNEGMRLYFDIIDGKVVIPYVGPHRPVSSSN